jgi:hypothetical protein
MYRSAAGLGDDHADGHDVNSFDNHHSDAIHVRNNDHDAANFRAWK